MGLNHKYTLVCDDVRREDNGKFFLVGLYTPGITLPKFPFRLAKLTFFNYFEPSETGTWELAFKLSHIDTGAIVGAEGRVKIELRHIEGSLVLPISITNPQFQMPGLYAFTVIGPNFEGITLQVPVEQRATPRVH